MEKKIAVLATGANGSCIAADLTEAGLDTCLIDQWPAHIEAMRERGLNIHAKDGETNTRVTAYHLCDVCTLSDRFDLVLLTSKGYDARWMATFIEPYLADDGILVAVQNCMTAENIAEIVGPERTVGCVFEVASQMFEPGEVTRSIERDRSWFAVGAFDPAHADRVGEVADVLRHAGKVQISDDIISAKWMKLIVNSMTMGLKAATGMTNEQLFGLNGADYARTAREMCLRSGAEALAAGQTLGYKVVPILGLRPDDVENTNSLLETLLDKIVSDVGPTAFNTVLQDHMKGRYSEVDMINGLVATEGQRTGRPTPVSDAIVEITRRIHAGEIAPDAVNLDLIQQEVRHRGG